HPSDNLGAILAVADWLSRNKKRPLLVKDVLTAMIKAHEIQGVLALENSFNRVGLDHVVLVKVASTAVVAPLLGCTYEQMDNVLFKISYPAEFHAQTAVEAAVQLHPLVKDRIGDIRRIRIRTHEAAVRIIDKKGPLANPADRDHCIQYMVAVPLLFGRLTA